MVLIIEAIISSVCPFPNLGLIKKSINTVNKIVLSKNLSPTYQKLIT